MVIRRRVGSSAAAAAVAGTMLGVFIHAQGTPKTPNTNDLKRLADRISETLPIKHVQVHPDSGLKFVINTFESTQHAEVPTGFERPEDYRGLTRENAARFLKKKVDAAVLKSAKGIHRPLKISGITVENVGEPHSGRWIRGEPIRIQKQFVRGNELPYYEMGTTYNRRFSIPEGAQGRVSITPPPKSNREKVGWRVYTPKSRR